MTALRVFLAVSAVACLTVVTVTGRVNGVALLGVIAAGVFLFSFERAREGFVSIVSGELPPELEEDLSRLDRLDGCDCPNAHVEARL